MDTKPRERRSLWLGLLPYTGAILFLCHVPIVIAASPDDPHTHVKVMQLAVIYLIGWTSLGSGLMHLFFAKKIAGSIGFETNQFQQEVGFAGVSMGATALIVTAYDPPYWLAIILVSSLYRFGAAYVHVRDIIVNRNYAVNNTGILILDIIVPTGLLLGYFAWLR